MFKFLVVLLFICQSSIAMTGTGLEISVSGDIVYEQGLNQTSEAEDKLKMRGAEILFFAPIDHNFDGKLSAAAHEEAEGVNFELHELFISSSKIIPKTNIKAGQFFLGIGRLNQIHQHDWVFTEAPKVHSNFFDDEGVFDSGLEFNYLLPTTSTFNLTAGLTSGYRYGHSHTSGVKPKSPTHYTRLSYFLPFNSTNGFQIGANYLGRTDSQDNQMRIAGIDVVAKWRKGKKISFLIQSETWYKSEADSQETKKELTGSYVFVEHAILESLSLGYRLDAFKDLTKKHSITNKKINNISYGALTQLTYSSSEFSKIRTTLSHSFDREEGQTSGKDTRFMMQLIFILGSHPAHVF